jgi:opacity protein-like surface antigen
VGIGGPTIKEIKMKKFMGLLALVFSLATGNALAADVDATDGKIAIGLQGGLLFADSKVSGSSISNAWNDEDGWVGGIFAEFGIWTLTLRPEFNYVRNKYSVGSVADVERDSMQLNALLKFNPFGAGVVSPFILVGPQWAKEVETEVTRRAGTTVVYADTSSKWDIAAVGAVGLEFNISEFIALGVQGRYIFGFRDIDDTTTEVKRRELEALANITFQNAF